MLFPNFHYLQITEVMTSQAQRGPPGSIERPQLDALAKREERCPVPTWSPGPYFQKEILLNGHISMLFKGYQFATQKFHGSAFIP